MVTGLRRWLSKFQTLRYLRAWYNMRVNPLGQTDETVVLNRLIAAVNPPRTFVEFGFHPHQFNCIGLLKTFRGLLIDGSEKGVALANSLLPEGVEARAMFLTLDNIHVVSDRFPKGTLGILSIDVDGNDFWFLKALLPIEPAIISIEYNASYGLRDLTSPYDPAFERLAKHASGWYGGASIVALDKLASAAGYDLVAVSEGGANLFFVRAQTRPASLPKLSPETSFRESTLRNRWSGTTVAEQWAAIKDLPYVGSGL